ncbi:MAG: ABC transporter substrate-binding protein [Gloeocapsa sp. DLM2.Bin57]|nr:MAG: ABC transporter substrate-binding protein [Gloeocapsa sp. DLM2.Bin57]
MLNHRQLKISLITLVTLLVVNPIEVQARKIRVGTAGSPPFIFNQEHHIPEGISVDIWSEIATAENLDYELIPQPNVRAGIEALIRGDLDILIGPLSITEERLKVVQFTQPYYASEIGLLVPTEATVWNLVRPFFRIAFISSIAVLILLLFGVGNLLWLAEKRRNPIQFPEKYLPGVSSGMWFALVTLTTVGYGDKAPITKTGKFIASAWMLISMVTASSLTAGLATALTIALSQQTTSEFNNPGDLFGQRIAVVEGTTSAQWGDYYQAKLVKAENLHEAIELLVQGKVKGVIFDAPAIRYYLTQNPDLNFTLANFPLARENYGFALPIESNKVHDLNVIIVRMDQEEEIDRIVERWLD